MNGKTTELNICILSVISIVFNVLLPNGIHQFHSQYCLLYYLHITYKYLPTFRYKSFQRM